MDDQAVARRRRPPRTVRGTGRLRYRVPFIVFMTAFGAYCAFLQIYLADVLTRLFLVRIFFQVAIAALVIASIRNLVGVRMLGMFSAVIIALAFLASGLLLGLALFAAIFAVVLLARGALVFERVQGAHRVAILVTVVGVAIASVVLLGLEIQRHELFFAVLFPVLISAWMAERYVEAVTRVGWGEPTEILGWTIAAIIVSFLVITQDVVVDFVMLNPLTWPLLVLLNWFLGTHVRFRLSERYRFGGVSEYGLADGPVHGDFADDVLTMNVRNREFISKYNSPEAMARLGKEEAKALLVPQGIPMAKTYMVLRTRTDVAAFRTWIKGHPRFVLKPARGHGGEGILVVRAHRDGVYDTGTRPMDERAIVGHALGILDGEYGGDRADTAVVEELLEPHPAMTALSPTGLADVRVISFLGYPVMAMVRIPTRASGGKANLHLGAVAAGVRLSTGAIIHCVWRGAPQPDHPDTESPLLGRIVPFWDEILEIAAEAQRLSGLGFAGVDLAVDANHGPVVMEVNRRPGLEIQNANAAGLLRRLRIVERFARAERPVDERLVSVRKLDADHWGLPASRAGRGRSPTAQPL